jgi:type II secretory pathway pseudopilin PulG
MKDGSAKQSGVSLVELVVGLMLMALLLAGTSRLLDASLSAWRAGSSRSEVQQTARFALDSMVRSLRYGDQYILENNKSITYRNRKSGPQLNYIYRYSVGSDHKLYHGGVAPYSSPQPVTGDNVKGFNSVAINANNEPLFSQPQGADSSYVVITVIAVDTSTGQRWETTSAVVSMVQVLK